MPTFCAVKKCRTMGGSGIPMHRFPSKLSNTGNISELGCERLKRWIAAINRDDLTETKIRNYRVCGKHFISGRKANLQDVKNPDWVPSVNLGYDPPISNSDILIEEFCRLCLNTKKNYYSLFETKGAEMLEALTSFTVRIEDPAPNVVCGGCFIELEKAYEIQQKFLKIEQFLQDQFTNDFRLKEETVAVVYNDDVSDSSISDPSNETPEDNVSENEEPLQEDNEDLLQTDDVTSNDNDMKADIKIEENSAENEKMIAECESLKEIQSSLHYPKRYDYDTIQCRICPKQVLVIDYKEHRQTHSDGYCHYCGITRKHLNSLRNHVLHEHREPKITCKKCNLVFNNKSSHDLHVRRIHTGEASYVCDICGHRFAAGRISELKKHIKSKHINHTRFVCDVCGKCFTLKDRLETHRLIHGDKSLFVCEFCGKGFNYKCNMNSHKKSVHGWKEVPVVKCNICAKGFPSQKALVAHLPKHWKNNEFKE